MEKTILIICLLLFSQTSFSAQSLELLLKIDKGLPTSGRNGSGLGEEVSYIGDVNKDGYDDWAVGLPGAAIYETGGSFGKVYIYYGGHEIPDNKDPDLILIGQQERVGFGRNVAYAGDVNNDGYDDIMVSYRYSVAVYFGGNPMDSAPDVIISDQNQSVFFGDDVSGAGDVNNDGFDDIVIDSKNHAYIFFGGNPMDSDVDVLLSGESEAEAFGSIVSAAGDVNGDGFDDVIIGAYYYKTDGYSTGGAYIFYGNSQMDSIADVILKGEAEYDYFDLHLTDAGDINNDGFDDVIVSVPRHNTNVENSGRIYIFCGADSMDSYPDKIIDGKYSGDLLGEIINSAGDINGDGFSDMIIGSAENIAIFFGDSLLENITKVVLINESITGHISGIAGGGDYNNDGFADVITGQYDDDKNGEYAGCVSLYEGGEQMDTTADAFFYGEPADDNLGCSVSSAGDVNHDGYDDIIVGAYGADIGEQNTGCAYIYFGGDNMDAIADVILPGYKYYGFWGGCVSSAGDVNDDGFSDVIIGGFQSQQARIYFGNAMMDSAADIIFISDNDFDHFGSAVAYAGDLNHDGYDDVIIGAHCDYTIDTQSGRAYIYFGGQSMDTNPDLILSGEAKFNFFGENVSYAGDVNNDGYDDVMVGAPGYEIENEDAGRVYIFYGGTIIHTKSKVTITGSHHQHLGDIIAPAGDVNNDGYNDIIVGAPYSGAMVGGISHVFIYFGGNPMNADADVIIENTIFEFGMDVAGIGDLNNDDYDDVMISDGNRVFFYYGGCNMDTIPDIILESEAQSANFGKSLSYAGDVNNDGHPDILIGAPENSAVGSRMGRAYIYSYSENTVAISASSDNMEKQYQLYQCYPNPFNPQTTIRYELPENSKVTLKIYNLLGQEVKTFFYNENHLAGTHQIIWDGKDDYGNVVNSGIYLGKISYGNFTDSIKLIYLK